MPNAVFNRRLNAPAVLASAPVVGPPTFTAQTTSALIDLSGSSPTYSATLDIGAAFAGRYVCAIFYATTNANMSAADFAGTPATVFATIGDDAGTSSKWRIACGTVNTGTTVVLNITTDDVIFGSKVAVYTANIADLVSATPVTGFASNGALPVTATANVAAGGAVLALSTVYGGTLIGPSFTSPNNPGVTADFTGAFQLVGSKSNSSAFTPASVSVTSGGTPGAMLVGLAAFR